MQKNFSPLDNFNIFLDCLQKPHIKNDLWEFKGLLQHYFRRYHQENTDLEKRLTKIILKNSESLNVLKYCYELTEFVHEKYKELETTIKFYRKEIKDVLISLQNILLFINMKSIDNFNIKLNTISI